MLDLGLPPLSVQQTAWVCLSTVQQPTNIILSQHSSLCIDGPMCLGKGIAPVDLVQPDVAQEWQTVQMHLEVGYHQDASNAGPV